MKKVILATMVAMGMAGSAFAVTAQSGIYIGALGGWSFPAKPSQDNMGAGSVSNRNYTYGFTLGYNYAFTPNWLAGIEASYINFGYNNYNNESDSFSDDPVFGNGTVTGGNDKLKSSGIQIMATGTYLMDNGFNVFGKVGAIDQKTEDNGSSTINSDGSGSLSAGQYSVSGSDSVTKWLPAAAIGVGYMPIQNLNIALQYERTFGDNYDNYNDTNSDDSKPMTQNAVTLGVTYNFAI